MRLLYLLQDVPFPASDGPRFKVMELLRVASKEHECDLLLFASRDAEKRIDALTQQLPGVRVLITLPTAKGMSLAVRQAYRFARGLPPTLARWDQHANQEAVRNVISRRTYDLVHLDAFGMAPYLAFCEGIPCVISTTDAISRAERMKAGSASLVPVRLAREGIAEATLRYERRHLPRASVVHVVSPVDAAYAREHWPGVSVAVVALPIPEQLITQEPRLAAPAYRSVFWSGGLRVDGIAAGLRGFLERGWPVVCRSHPDVHLRIVGRAPSSRMLALIQSQPRVSFTQWVPDFHEEVAASSVVLCTDRSGTGLKTRILHAFALARPVVSTSAGLEGFPVIDGVHCLRRDSEEGLAEGLQALLDSEHLARNMGESARDLAIRQYSPVVIGRQWLDLYRRVADPSRVVPKARCHGCPSDTTAQVRV